MTTFYTEKENGEDEIFETNIAVSKEWLNDVLLPIITKTSRVSIRLVDWLVTNYAKEYSVCYHWQDDSKKYSRMFCVHSEYKQCLRSKRRRHFDPFRRGKRIYFYLNGVKYATTIGQLVFFLWADKYKVLEYLEGNARAVETHMAERQEQGKKRRRKLQREGETLIRKSLSKKPTETHMFYANRCTLHFDSDSD